MARSLELNEMTEMDHSCQKNNLHSVILTVAYVICFQSVLDVWFSEDLLAWPLLSNRPQSEWVFLMVKKRLKKKRVYS